MQKFETKCLEWENLYYGGSTREQSFVFSFKPHCFLDNLTDWLLIHLLRLRVRNSPTGSPLRLDCWPEP